MAILSTTLRGTNSTYWQAEAKFDTKILTSSPLNIIIELQVLIGGQTFNNAFLLASDDPICQIKIVNGKSEMKGLLKLIEAEKAVVFEGTIVSNNYVRINSEPSIVATW
ncbi:hypothetical protein [Chryseobacterium takakiae]|jgi:hypothetical protein|uniref:Uncharacterized protein n=1 Tax=Chryseobacterium takakiae TaxID=1302685 RepID=A0A1M5BM66_9FLAO|nr:hypothetical protein [Chryseobacterium takakiae]SHF43302.1 hypothetical protein SAMN05444408_12026 [Chryseobacterium takakiae]